MAMQFAALVSEAFATLKISGDMQCNDNGGRDNCAIVKDLAEQQ